MSESQAASTCREEVPCKSFCAAAINAGCGGASEEACIATCEQDRLATGSCKRDQDSLRACQGFGGVTCEVGVPMGVDCADDALRVADCVKFDDPCLAHCIAAEVAGCGGESREACTSACKATFESLTSCQDIYEDLLLCNAQRGVTCDGSTAKSVAGCESTQTGFDKCTGGM